MHMHLYIHSLLLLATGPNVLLFDTNVCFLSRFNADIKFLIFTELIVSLVLHKKTNKANDDLRHITQKLRIDQGEPLTNRGSLLVFKS